MSDCLFCKIAAGEIPCTKVFSNDSFIAFRDIAPQAPTHILVIPRVHIAGLSDFTDDHEKLAGELMTTAVKIAENEGLVPGGYRFVINNGVDGGQTVPHLHLHLLGGRSLAWPPG